MKREMIFEFARAVGCVHALNRDVSAANFAGYGDVVASPTFVAIVEMAAFTDFISTPGIDIDISRILHVSSRIESHRPIVAGIELSTVLAVTGVRERVDSAVLSTACEIRTKGDELMSTVESTWLVNASPRDFTLPTNSALESEKNRYGADWPLLRSPGADEAVAELDD